MSKVRILLVDPHAVVREGFKNLLNTQANFHVVAETSNAKSALTLAESLKPDLVVIDISSPGFKFASWITHLQVFSPKTKLLVLALREDKRLAKELLAAGASGVLLKQAAADSLISAVHAAIYDPPAMETSAGLAPDSNPSPRSVATQPPHPHLTDQEEEVVRLVGQGFTNIEIADRLEMSIRAVETCKLQAMKKLQLRSRIDVVRYADAQGWLDGP
jgi:DNA-binding NarL/FixJ family response regulator